MMEFVKSLGNKKDVPNQQPVMYVHISKQHEVVSVSLKVDPGACVLPEDQGLPLRLGVMPTSPSERWCLQMAFTTQRSEIYPD